MMAKTRVLLTGASGMLGPSIAASLASISQLKCIAYRNATAGYVDDAIHCDLTCTAELEKIILDFKPNVVINAAAASTIDQCVNAPELARQLNIELPAQLALLSLESGFRLIHLSTDQVYDGGSAWSSEEQANPINHYGLTKLGGESAAIERNKHTIVLRLALVYGLGRGQRLPFSHWLISQLIEQKTITVFNDEFRTPLFIDDLCQLLKTLIQRGSGVPGGVYNTGSTDRLSRAEMAEVLADAFDLDKKLITPASVTQLDNHQFRPRDCSMDCDKLFSATDWRPSQFRAAAAAMIEQYH